MATNPKLQRQVDKSFHDRAVEYDEGTAERKRRAAFQNAVTSGRVKKEAAQVADRHEDGLEEEIRLAQEMMRGW